MTTKTIKDIVSILEADPTIFFEKDSTTTFTSPGKSIPINPTDYAQETDFYISQQTPIPTTEITKQTLHNLNSLTYRTSDLFQQFNRQINIFTYSEPFLEFGNIKIIYPTEIPHRNLPDESVARLYLYPNKEDLENALDLINITRKRIQ